MRVLVFLLALANLLFFAFSAGYFGRPDNPDAIRMQKQINPDSIRIASRGDPPADKPATKTDAGSSAATAKEDAKPAPKEEVKVTEAVCLTWSNLTGKDADRLSALLTEKFEDFKLLRKPQPQEGASWWVYVPPLANKGDADKKMAELKKMGISDLQVIQDAGPNRWALSLGVFSAEAGAKERLAKVRDKGVKSAKIGPRHGKDVTHLIEARGPAARHKPLQEAVAALSPDMNTKLCQ